MIGFLSFVTLITVALAAPSEDFGETHVISGGDAEDDEFPYQVSLQECRGHYCTHLCGGAIISPTSILTAAHCCDSQYTYNVLAGTTKLSDFTSRRRDIKPSGFTKHENYKGSTGPSKAVIPHDICIIHLAKPISYYTNVQPVVLPLPNTTAIGSAILSGWGFNGSLYPDTLQKAHLHIITDFECKNAILSMLPYGYPFEWIIEFVKNTGIICTSGKGSASACIGDTGSPLVQNGILIGVSSWGVGAQCSSPNSPTVYTAVNQYIDWIHRHIKDLQGTKAVEKPPEKKKPPQKKKPPPQQPRDDPPPPPYEPQSFGLWGDIVDNLLDIFPLFPF